MRKQTKLVAVLSAAALLAMGASMTSFAAGWEKDDAGVWHYYDRDDEMVADEWRKDGAYWFYLDEDGDMLTDAWVDDDYYVDSDGRMLVNAWKKTISDEDEDDPEDGGEHWYYFGNKGKKVTDDDKKIGGKTYYFDEDGKMLTGWQEINGEGYYLGNEDEGWRAENQWLWLEKSGALDNDNDDDETLGEPVLDCDDDDDDLCDDEGWYWFQSSGKLYHDTGKKKINGKYYIFNAHGQMLYEWIDNDTTVTHASNAQLDGNLSAASGSSATPKPDVDKLLYYNEVDDGSRGNGWYQIDGAEDRGNDGDTDWYYIDDGEITYADGGTSDFATYDKQGDPIYLQRIKVEGKYFAFNEEGQMQTGLQYAKADHGFYYFDENGYQKTGRVSSVECDDDDYTFYFNTKNGKNGQGYKGIKDNYLYFNGKRLDADDDYRLYYYNGDIYLTNNKGKIQKAKSEKKYDIENKGIAEDDVIVKTDSNGRVEYIKLNDGTSLNADQLRSLMLINLFGSDNISSHMITNGVMEDTIVSVPFISLYDDDVYTYNFWTATNSQGDKVLYYSESWMEINDSN